MDVEWPELDNVFEAIAYYFFNYITKYTLVFDMIFRCAMCCLFHMLELTWGYSNADKLPKMLSKLRHWLADLQSRHPTRVFCSYRLLGKLCKNLCGLESFDLLAYDHPDLEPLRKRLSSPPDLALAVICAENSYRNKENELRKLAVYLERQVQLGISVSL